MIMRRLFLHSFDAPAPIGPIHFISDESGLVALDFGAPEDRLFTLLRARFGADVSVNERGDPLDVASTLDAYFEGRFDPLDAVPVDGGGTPFQRRVWDALRDIPAGETRSYGQLAAGFGKPNGARAVGLANSLNPINLAVPCHRVIGSAGALTGYGGGIERKRWLLAHERKMSSDNGATRALFSKAGIC
jgi:methylated-DNA-[protein]-cysteine S-methyltransferase